MTNEMQPNTPSENHQHYPFGARLKSAREARGLAHKDAAAQLRLNERVITMMEKNDYPTDLPITFIRGYLRLYGKFLEIPEQEIKLALEPLKPKPLPQASSLSTKEQEDASKQPYYMSFFTYFIVMTLIGFIGIWWFNRSVPEASSAKADNTSLVLPEEIRLDEFMPSASSSPLLDNALDNTLDSKIGLPLASDNHTNSPAYITKPQTAAPEIASAPVETDNDEVYEETDNARAE